MCAIGAEAAMGRRRRLRGWDLALCFLSEVVWTAEEGATVRLMQLRHQLGRVRNPHHYMSYYVRSARMQKTALISRCRPNVPRNCSMTRLRTLEVTFHK